MTGVLSPLTICSGWLIQRFHDEPSLQLPVALIGLTLFVWMIAIGQQVLYFDTNTSMGSRMHLTQVPA